MLHFSPRHQAIRHPPVTWRKAFGVHCVIFTHFELLTIYPFAWAHTQPEWPGHIWLQPVSNKPGTEVLAGYVGSKVWSFLFKSDFSQDLGLVNLQFKTRRKWQRQCGSCWIWVFVYVYFADLNVTVNRTEGKWELKLQKMQQGKSPFSSTCINMKTQQCFCLKTHWSISRS